MRWHIDFGEMPAMVRVGLLGCLAVVACLRGTAGAAAVETDLGSVGRGRGREREAHQGGDRLDEVNYG